jgi:hypothetical protein
VTFWCDGVRIFQSTDEVNLTLKEVALRFVTCDFHDAREALQRMTDYSGIGA